MRKIGNLLTLLFGLVLAVRVGLWALTPPAGPAAVSPPASDTTRPDLLALAAAALSTLDVAGMAEDLTLYVTAGKACGFAQHRAVDSFASHLAAIDAKAFETGAMRGLTLFRGMTAASPLETVCEGAAMSRPKMEKELDRVERLLINGR